MAKPIAQLRQETRTPIDGGTGGSGGSKEPTGIQTLTSFAEKSESSQPQTESQPGMFGNIPLNNNPQPSGADATNGDTTPPTGTSGTPGTSADTINGADARNGTTTPPTGAPGASADATNGTNPDNIPPELRALSFISKESKIDKNSSVSLTGCEKMEKLFNDKLAAVKSKYKLTDDSYSPASKDSATKLIDPSSKSECFKINTGKIEHFGEKILDDDCQAAAYMYAAFVHLFPPKSLDTFSFYTDQDLTLFEPGNSKFFQALDEKQSGISLKQVCPNKFQNIKERYEYVNDANEKTSKDTATKIINSKSKSECFEMDQGKIIAFGENVLHSSCHEISSFYAANIYSSEDTKDLSEFMVDSAFDLTPYEIENTEFINSLNL